MPEIRRRRLKKGAGGTTKGAGRRQCARMTYIKQECENKRAKREQCTPTVGSCWLPSRTFSSARRDQADPASGGRSLHTVIFCGVRPKPTPNRSRDVRYLWRCERGQPPISAADHAHTAKDIGAYRIRSSLKIVSLSRVLRIARVSAANSGWLVPWTMW